MSVVFFGGNYNDLLFIISITKKFLAYNVETKLEVDVLK